MRKLLFLSFIFLLLASGCSKVSQVDSQKNESGNKKIQITTTFYPMYYFAKQVAGEAAEVDMLIPSGVEPHDWEPTTKDLMKIQDSDVFIYNSRFFETWTKKVFNSIDDSNIDIVEASKDLELMDATAEEDEHEYDVADNNEEHISKDPHVWLSPVLASQEVDNIAASLIHADPKNTNLYKKNASVLKGKLQDLDKLYRDTVEKADRKMFVTQHAAFGYLADQYGLQQIPIAGLSPDAEPTLNALKKLAVYTKNKNVNIIYFEGLTSPKVAKTLANEIGAATEVLNPLEGLTKEEEKQGLDYIGVMKKNLAALEKSFNSK